ncbi:MAG: peptide chain release factor 3 [Filifactoraceae bacterium]
MNRQELIQEIDRRRIFAIISHPDAGKTTLTEKLLLHGGVIREAGTVSAQKNTKYAKSDWMELEKKRGISITSSVMQFEYDKKKISIMDTPGHNDFGEDTYRVLTSVDNAVMVIDGAKGIERQTKKLFQVCKMRGIPIFTFINKMDRQTKEPLELLQELEDVLGIHSVPITWPIGSGMSFQGIYDRLENKIIVYRKNQVIDLGEEGLNNPILDELFEKDNILALRDEMELIEGAGNEFELKKIHDGQLTPVFFGTALVDFGVTTFLNHFLDMSIGPGERKTINGSVSPYDSGFSGFIFKIQANMNSAHRDRIAFLRICSGIFERGMNVTVARTGNQSKISQSTQLMANDREIIDVAYAGDVIGIYDSGNYRVGDTLVGGKEKIVFQPLPTFPPELFMRVSPKNVMKAKHFQKGVEQLAQEGAIQVYRSTYNDIILGAVGALQFEVFEYRLKNEYNSEIYMENLDYTMAKWLITEEELDIKKLQNSRSMFVKDHYDRPLLLFANQFTCDRFQDDHKDIRLIDALEINSLSEVE